MAQIRRIGQDRITFPSLRKPMIARHPLRFLPPRAAAQSLRSARSFTTWLSRLATRPAPAIGRPPSLGALARSSLCLLVTTMALPACLVTSTPSFDPPKQTRPFLVPSSADPDPRGVLIVDSLNLPTFFEFTADVVSNDAGEDVELKLYLDYGSTNVAGQPFLRSVGNRKSLPASTMDQTNRPPAKLRWYPGIQDVGFGCHTFTMMASHHFDETLECPVCRNDSSQITWPMYRCDSSKPMDTPCSVDFSACTVFTDTCHEQADPDAGVSCGAAP
jgi:hypothetical protein